MYGIWQPGGIATYIRRLSKAQEDAGHTVHYLDTCSFASIDSKAVDLPIVVRDECDLFVQARILGLDILHLHTTVSVSPPSDIPVIRTVHNNNPYCPSGSKHLKRWGQPCDRAYNLGGCLWGHFVDGCGSVRPQRFYPGFQRVRQDMHTLSKIPSIANSQFVKDRMLSSGYCGENIHLLHYPAPEIKDNCSPEQHDIPHFVFLGRITPEKGLSWLLRALNLVKVPLHLDIAGSGNKATERAIQTKAKQLGLMDRITFHGWLNELQALQLIQKARALIFPSVWHEPAGIVSLEAAAVGRPVIASKVGGIPEYTERLQNALLVEPNDVEGLASRIEQLATDFSLAQRLGEEGRKKAKEEFSLEKHLQELMKLYEAKI